LNNGFWVAIVLTAGVLGFLSGYSVSTHTGVEPGYFDAPEAAGYGAAEAAAPEGISEEEQEYYKSLTADE